MATKYFRWMFAYGDSMHPTDGCRNVDVPVGVRAVGGGCEERHCDWSESVVAESERVQASCTTVTVVVGSKEGRQAGRQDGRIILSKSGIMMVVVNHHHAHDSCGVCRPVHVRHAARHRLSISHHHHHRSAVVYQV